MYQREELHPGVARKRHSELRAAIANGKLTRKDGRPWSKGDFAEPDPWAPAKPPAAAPAPAGSLLRAQVASINASRRRY